MADSNTIPIADWLKFVSDEYLSTFIKDGGASVKFAVTSDELRPKLCADVKALCEKMDYVFVKLDAATRRVHMPQDIYFGLASQLDWPLMARRLVLRLAEEKGYLVESIDPANSGSVFDAIANANGLDSQFVQQIMTPAIQDDVYKNSNLARDFRVAMSHLCMMNEGPALLDWLTGANTRISNVRPFSIRTSINRTTARYFIESALYWVHYAGFSGTVIMLDNSRVTLARNPRDGQRYYTRAMAMEHYELLREFVDGVDRLSGTLFVVATNYDFVYETGARGYGIYQALRTRIMDDVRDRSMVNPVASLVRLSEETRTA